MSKYKLLLRTVISILVIFLINEGAGFVLKHDSISQLEGAEPGNEEISLDKRDLEKEYNGLLEKFEAVKQDRNNLLIQAKRLLKEKRSVADLEESIESLELEKEAFEKEKEEMLSLNQKIQEELKQLKDTVAELESESGHFKTAYEKAKKGTLVKELQKKILTLEQESEKALIESEKKIAGLSKECQTLKSDLKDTQAELDKFKKDNERINKEIAELRKNKDEELAELRNDKEEEIKDLNKSIDKFKNDYAKSQKEVNYLEKAKDKIDKEVKKINENLSEYKKNYSDAVKKNNALEREAKRIPKRFTEISRQNTRLLKETSQMHYNLGVFYTKRQEYKRAISEFLKAVEINPEDAYAHFNLGYIYAEYLINREKAIEHFRHYLRLAKSGDSDLDWVRKYLLTWETYEGKNIMRK
ncbi:MAG: tetratricopeptide repeat protein [Candidatus Omnitrophica bacterium]|nr:tetratricopeptide repeat protein [Candidatus Omnitrophota bacterium]MBU1852726.1 tetratricopeptide repeat protein [Candidatus Omnitrophota bacterium]